VSPGEQAPGATEPHATCDISPFADLIAHDPDDMTVTVQAGMTLASVQALLARCNQQLPVDVPLPGRVTVGGLIAADISGSRRHFRGGVRDLLLGVGVIGAEGRFLRAGGRVVKNVAGYDLCKLYTGSHGWLGVIVEATFRVYPIPEAAAGVAVSLQSPREAEAVYSSMQDGSLRPVAVDLLDHATAEQLGLPPAPWTLLVAFEDLREVVEAQVAECRELFERPRTELGAAQVRAAIQRIADGMMGDGVHVRFNLLSSDVAEFVEQLTEARPSTRLWSHLADGVVHALFDVSDVQGARHAAERVVGRGGSWIIPPHDCLAAGGLPMLGPPRPEWRLMRKVKAALDPANIFGRGGPFDRALCEVEGA
jgi:glycolate oxidase FAD binding subunit